MKFYHQGGVPRDATRLNEQLSCYGVTFFCSLGQFSCSGQQFCFCQRQFSRSKQECFCSELQIAVHQTNFDYSAPKADIINAELFLPFTKFLLAEALATIKISTMKHFALGLLLVFICSSWKADTRGPWITTKGKRVVLYTRPLSYSKAISPDSLAIQAIIAEQEQVIDYINEKLKVNFDSKVEIYLYNYDEAKEKIGTNGGGFASLDGRNIFYTYFGKTFFNSIRNADEYVGVHEMVHTITLNELGNIRTRFFGEGYSNAVDGNYGSMLENNRMVRLRNDSTLVKIKKRGILRKPSELLYNDSIPEREYYPQAGSLIRWMFDTYGVEKINKLFALKREKIEEKFFAVTGERFIDMEKRYMDYQLKN